MQNILPIKHNINVYNLSVVFIKRKADSTASEQPVNVKYSSSSSFSSKPAHMDFKWIKLLKHRKW